jgi:hypothetical protein
VTQASRRKAGSLGLARLMGKRVVVQITAHTASGQERTWVPGIRFCRLHNRRSGSSPLWAGSCYHTDAAASGRNQRAGNCIWRLR